MNKCTEIIFESHCKIQQSSDVGHFGSDLLCFSPSKFDLLPVLIPLSDLLCFDTYGSDLLWFIAD
jgi:hypothetical protein